MENKKKMKTKIIILIVIIIAVGLLITVMLIKNNKEIDESDTQTQEELQEKIYEIGDTIETEVFTYTLKNAEFVEGINCDEQDDFFIPSSTGDRVLTAGDGYKLLYFTAEYKFNGKSSLESNYASRLFVPQVQYKDYNIDSNYIVFHNPHNEWYLLNTDLNYTVRQNYKLDQATLDFRYEPLEENIYEVQGTISVPEAAASDEQTSLTLNFALINHVGESINYGSYKFKIR